MLTAYNVISSAPRLQLRRADQSYDQVTVVGFDEVRDLALLKIETSAGPFVSLSPRPAAVGERVFSMGYGQRLVPTVKALTGRVVALNVLALRGDFPSGTLQLDVPIYRGDGGGAVLNEAGEVLGVTSYIQSNKVGVSVRVFAYANPVTADAPILTALAGGLQREAPVLGVTVGRSLTNTTLTPKYFQDRGLGSALGCPFNQLVPGGPAARAGLHPLNTKIAGAAGAPDQLEGDVIVAVGGKPVARCLDLLALVRQHQVGDSVTVSVIRDGQTPARSVTVTLAARSRVAAVPLPVTNQQLF